MYYCNFDEDGYILSIFKSDLEINTNGFLEINEEEYLDISKNIDYRKINTNTNQIIVLEKNVFQDKIDNNIIDIEEYNKQQHNNNIVGELRQIDLDMIRIIEDIYNVLTEEQKNKIPQKAKEKILAKINLRNSLL